MLHSKLCRFIIVFAFAIISALWVGTLWRIEYEYHADIRSTLQANENMAMAFEKHIWYYLDNIDEMLVFLKLQYEKGGMVNEAIKERILAGQSIQAMQVSVADPNGKIVASLLINTEKLDVSNQEYFMAHQKADTGEAHVSQPVIDNVTGRAAFYLSRRINRPDGSFGGVVVCGIESRYFSEFYHEVNLGSGSAITIVGLDGVIRMRQTSSKMEFGQDVLQTANFLRMKERLFGSYSSISVIDHQPRIFSFRHMDKYPLIVQISVLEAEALAGYRERALRYYVAAGLSSLVLLIVFAFLAHMVLKKEQTEEKLRTLNANLERTVDERTAELTALNEELEAMNEELQRLTLVDGLTGIANRRHFDEYLDREWRRGLRQQKPLALIMADIDFFKSYNDVYGHQRGDGCLKTVAVSLVNSLNRVTDLAARYGGEEFAVILPDTDLEGARVVAEKIRRHVEDLRIESKGVPNRFVTLSLGVASLLPSLNLSATMLLSSSDAVLFDAKNAGRNRVMTKSTE